MRIDRQDGLPYDPDEIAARPLPGTRPVGDAPWLLIRDDYGAQMAERDRLLAERRSEVVALRPDGRAAAAELLAQVRAALTPDLGFAPVAGGLRRPDGQTVIIDTDDPLGSLGRLLPADFCLLHRQGDEHILTGAILCFPSAWTLAEKLGRPLTRIHRPVVGYASVAHRVQRLFDGVAVGSPLWRANLLEHGDDRLFQPQPEAAPRDRSGTAPAVHRSERQVFWRLPETRDVVFAIETRIWPVGTSP